MKKVKIAADVDADKVAALTPALPAPTLAISSRSGAAATRRGADATSMAASATLSNGCPRSGKEKQAAQPQGAEIVAYHEMGHALVALALPGCPTRFHKVSIIPRGIGALG